MTCYLLGVRPAHALALLGLPLAWASACGDDRPGPLARADGGAGTGGSSGIDTGLSDGPPSPDASGLCGNLVVPVLSELPNLYFVVDRSGSMADPLAGTSHTKYQNARIAIGSVLRSIGHRVRYGAAVFPAWGAAANDGCAPGEEVFPTQQGDPPTYAAAGQDGPILQSMLGALNVQPLGGTPTSSTLEGLTPALTALEGKTFVVLATDGAPNCNESATCTAEECMINVEGGSVNDKKCDASLNCCAPSLGGPIWCVDRPASVKAIADLYAAGISTYVIGMPGSETYANVLDEMAVSGGTARPTSPKYYSVKDAGSLTASIKEIGVKVAISCSVPLEAAPPDPEQVNVYLDSSLVQLDPLDGWVWTSETSLELRGEACEKLMSGDVLQVQVVAGCPTSVK